MSDNPRPYQVCLYVGDTPPEVPNLKVVDVTAPDATPDAVLAKMDEVELTPADMRARVLFVVDDTTDSMARDRAVITYAAWMGFAGRELDVAVGSEVLDAPLLVERSATLPADPRPEDVLEQVQIGAPRTDALPVVGTGDLDAATVAALRWARRVRFAPAADAFGAINEFLAIAAIRRRGQMERFPYLVAGDEPAELPSGEVPGVCLDDVRRRAQELRRSRRGGNRDAIADPVPLDARRRTLLAASAVDVADTLARLGVAADPETELWHCPRPSRHTNGDRNASMRVTDGRVKCFRCDAERVDSLRLVMDTTGMTPDEAAAWLLSDAAFAAPVG